MTTPTPPDFAEQVKLAAEAFIYGYPLVYSMHELAKFPSGPNLIGQEPLMRMYQPKEPIMNGTYLLPALKCVG